MDSTDSNEAHRKACRAARVKVSKLHDWRHTYAIYSLEDGMAPQVVLASTHESALKVCRLEDLKAHSVEQE